MPPSEFVKAVVEQAILPTILDLQGRTGLDLSARVESVGDHELDTVSSELLVGPSGKLAGRVRLGFRATFFPDRFTYVFESIYPAAKASRWTGFVLEGKVRATPDGVIATKGNPTMNYGQRRWIFTAL